MKNILTFILLISFCFSASTDEIIAESQKNKAKAETTQILYNSNIGQAQYINYQWSLIAQEKSNENAFLRSACVVLLVGSVAYLGGGEVCMMVSSGITGGICYYLWGPKK